MSFLEVSAAQTDEVLGFLLFTILFGLAAYHLSKDLFRKKEKPMKSERLISRLRTFHRSHFILIYFVLMAFALIFILFRYAKQL